MNIMSNLSGSLILDIVIFEIFNVEEVTVITVFIAVMSDIIESLIFAVDKNQLSNDFCCVMLAKFCTLKDAEINVNREYEVVAK